MRQRNRDLTQPTQSANWSWSGAERQILTNRKYLLKNGNASNTLQSKSGPWYSWYGKSIVSNNSVQDNKLCNGIRITWNMFLFTILNKIVNTCACICVYLYVWISMFNWHKITYTCQFIASEKFCPDPVICAPRDVGMAVIIRTTRQPDRHIRSCLRSSWYCFFLQGNWCGPLPMGKRIKEFCKEDICGGIWMKLTHISSENCQMNSTQKTI